MQLPLFGGDVIALFEKLDKMRQVLESHGITYFGDVAAPVFQQGIGFLKPPLQYPPLG